MKYVHFKTTIVVNTIQELFLSVWIVFFYCNFLFQLNTSLCNMLAIERSVTAAYHSTTNGLDVQTNHNIKQQVFF